MGELDRGALPVSRIEGGREHDDDGHVLDGLPHAAFHGSQHRPHDRHLQDQHPYPFLSLGRRDYHGDGHEHYGLYHRHCGHTLPPSVAQHHPCARRCQGGHSSRGHDLQGLHRLLLQLGARPAALPDLRQDGGVAGDGGPGEVELGCIFLGDVQLGKVRKGARVVRELQLLHGEHPGQHLFCEVRPHAVEIRRPPCSIRGGVERAPERSPHGGHGRSSALRQLLPRRCNLRRGEGADQVLRRACRCEAAGVEQEVPGSRLEEQGLHLRRYCARQSVCFRRFAVGRRASGVGGRCCRLREQVAEEGLL
mmetsp:Transcript_28614/g.81287  ORF Transcript_28614/g.81287 Transcript_28614/m.81287 type:complete len:307 (-) Transcript_28614:1495-2415(-)